MGIYNPSIIELFIYFCIFSIGVIVGRVLMAVQVAVMKSSSKSLLKKFKDEATKF